MAHDRLQLQRFELKYIISETVALAVRDFVSAYLVLDEYGAGRPQLAYPIHSLYLDSNRLSLYWHAINGNKNRFKLRLRFYNDRPDAPVYFEIKSRTNDAIRKQRAAVQRKSVANLLNGQLAAESELIFPGSKAMAAVQRFLELMTLVRARPLAHVAYRREAWVSPADNSVRVTLDRDVRFEPEMTACLATEMRNPLSVFGQKVILEIKFTGLFPDWFGELVRVFDLTRGSAAKYVDGVTLVGEDRLAVMVGNHLATQPYTQATGS